MVDIDEIMNMLDWHKDIKTQKKGIELAKSVKCINAFIQPMHLGCSKNVWDNCAEILASRKDEELLPYLTEILQWIDDLNWPGAEVILERMKRFSKVQNLSLAIQETINILDANEKDIREIWLTNLSKLLDNKKLKEELTVDTLNTLKKYYNEKESFIERYIFYIAKSQYTMLEKDYINSDKYIQELKRIKKEYENEEYYKEALNELMKIDDFGISLEAAKDCIKHNINIDKTIKTLEDLSKREDLETIAFEARNLIKDWKEKYQKEKE